MRMMMEPLVFMVDIMTDCLDILSFGVCANLTDMLDGMFQCLVCCVTCPPAFMCWLIVFVIAWTVARPVYLVLVIILGAILGVIYYLNKDKNKGQGDAAG